LFCEKENLGDIAPFAKIKNTIKKVHDVILLKFTWSKIEIAKQIGNAVPPLLVARVADVVRVMPHWNHKNGRLIVGGKNEKNNHSSFTGRCCIPFAERL
jgi:hypothetical protein